MVSKLREEANKLFFHLLSLLVLTYFYYLKSLNTNKGYKGVDSNNIFHYLSNSTVTIRSLLIAVSKYRAGISLSLFNFKSLIIHDQHALLSNKSLARKIVNNRIKERPFITNVKRMHSISWYCKLWNLNIEMCGIGIDWIIKFK